MANNIKKTFLIILTALLFVVIYCCSNRFVSYYSVSNNSVMYDKNKKVLCIPLTNLNIKYVDNTRSAHVILFSDSFFLEAANNFIYYEASKYFDICNTYSPQDSSDLIYLLKDKRYSLLKKDTSNYCFFSDFVKNFANNHNIDLIIFPYSCEIKNIVYQPPGWRNNRFGPYYERPVSYKAKTFFHIQIWDKTGNLIYERETKCEAEKPFLYSLFKKENKSDKEDLIEFSKHLYSPPIIKSLYNSIKLSLMIRN